MRSLRLELPYPPSVNAAWRCVSIRSGPRTLCRTLLSVAGRKYREKVIASLRASGAVTEAFTGPVSVSIHLYPKDNRIQDIDNAIKPLLDVLEHAGVLGNDRQVVDLAVSRHPPGAEGYRGVALVFVIQGVEA